MVVFRKRFCNFQALTNRLGSNRAGQLAGLALICTALLAGLAGCAPAAAAPSAGAAPTVTKPGAGQSPNVQEYVLVEQSTDNPNHLGFAGRALEAVRAHEASGWHNSGARGTLQSANQALYPFGFRLVENTVPPFSAYAVYQGDRLVQADIAHFGPVVLDEKGKSMEGNFMLPVETYNGDRLVVSSVGVGPWPGQSSHLPNGSSLTPPVYFGSELAYASITSDAAQPVLYLSDEYSARQSTVHWKDDSGRDHWAQQMEHGVILDGQDLNKVRGYQESFGLRMLNGLPMFFYTSQGLTHIHYAGRDLPFTYDQVVHGNQDALSMYNPGGLEYLSWFYALRDGLWYYVEVGFGD